MTRKQKDSCIPALLRAGISWEDAHALRRASMTLQRWFELECGDGNDYGSWAIERARARQDGARKRIAKILASYPGLFAYVQTDPRGCALYILRAGDIPEGQDPSCYYSRGLPVYK